MSRLSIRIRLTLVFTLALALMLAAAGAFVYQRHRTDLDAAIDQGLTRGSASSPTGRRRAVRRHRSAHAVRRAR